MVNKLLILFRCSGYPGIFCDPGRNCLFFNTNLYEEMNIKLRNYLHASGTRDLPNMDPKLTEGMRSMMNPAQIKRERYEEHFQQQQQPMFDQGPPQDYHQPPPQVSQVDPVLQQRFPNKLFQASGIVIQHLGRDMAIFESLEKTWKCLVFLETVAPYHGQRVMDLKAHLPLQSTGMVNGTLIAVDKPIQYISNLTWKPSGMAPNPAMGRDITDQQMARYYEVISKFGQVLEVQSRMGANQPPHDIQRQSFLLLPCP